MKVAVIGAGCGGQAIAGYLASRGNEVNLYNRSAARILPLVGKKEITLEGSLSAKGQLNMATTSIADAVKGAELIMVVTTATGHYPIAELMAPHLKDGQTVVLNPGRTFGSLEFMNSLLDNGCTADVNVAEANTLVYATRTLQPGVSVIKGVKEKVALSVIPHANTLSVLSMLCKDYPQFYAGGNFMATSLGNIGAVFHPTITLLNKDRIRGQEQFEFYREGATREAVEYMKKVDSERLAIADAFGIKVPPLREWLCERYGLDETELYDALHNNPSYAGISAPQTLDMRYLNEDVPTGLVPLSLLGRAVGVETGHMDKLIDDASSELDTDFRAQGRTLDKLGLSPKTIFSDLERVLSIRKITEYQKMRDSA